MKSILVPFLFILIVFGCSDKETSQKATIVPIKKEQKLNGASLEMPNKVIKEESFQGLKAMNVDWVSVIPYAYTRKNASEVVYNYQHQWWGEREEGVIETIQLAKNQGIKVMLKPHVWISGEGWPGKFNCSSEAEWKQWEDSYSAYILRFATIADSMDVPVFCIGTEYRIAVRERPKFWSALIDSVRSVYKNKVTYAANWDNYERVSFWKQLDFIGIDAYFPITSSKHPSVDELEKGFEKLSMRLETFSDSCDQQIVFTEYGFRSLDYATSGYYKYQINELSTNPQLQANAYTTFFNTLWKEPWMLGGFFWKYQFRSEKELGGLENNKYTPQFKPAERIITENYRVDD
ncbi:MAG: hypothetical protein COA32_01960 [Fluviicola sp.]|nr:MAG: hypothetical protein COA32_01960 [Fluviicola sp.]